MSDAIAPENKRDRFVRLAESRVSNALRALRIIGNLANRAHYEFGESDVRKIVSRLHKEVDALARRFEDVPEKSRVEFKL